MVDITGLLYSFAHALTSAFALQFPFNPEDQLKSPVSRLLELVGAAILGKPIQAVTEVQVSVIKSRPDIGLAVNGLLAGYVELKAPGKGAKPDKFKGADKAQWEKLKNLPNLIYTDGNEWSLYRSGVQVGKSVRMSGDVTKDGHGAIEPEDAERLAELIDDFCRWEPITPSSPNALAEILAPLCRLLRTEVLTALENPMSNVSGLAGDWKLYFFPNADNPQFADAYAQTLTYALLLARLSGAADLSVATASTAITPGHPLLAVILNRLSDPAARDEIKTSADLLERVIQAVDASKFVSASGDPWLYFYENFLAKYDPKMRRDRGVYYTPVSVVRCQVSLVSQLLADRFEADFSFLSDGVVTLDPSTGTGTYILAAIDHGLKLVETRKGPGARMHAATVAAKNVHAFEILVGPYAVAHLRLTQQVIAEGGTLPKDGVHVYLTDTLESPNAAPPNHLPMPYRQLGAEHERASKVKKDTKVLVCIGNPPYDRQELEAGQNKKVNRKGGWVRFGDVSQTNDRPLLQDFIEPLIALNFGVHAKNLYNDYVYFWRWALWKVFETGPGPGIVSFITASSYLVGPGFAGMRKVMRATFDELWIIDLEGGNLGARRTENVFTIQTPVAIAIGVSKGANASMPAIVRYSRITGTQAEKFEQLDSIRTFADLKWRECFGGWTAPFLPFTDTEYWSLPLLTDIFPWQMNGMQYKRTWPIGESREVLERRWHELLEAGDRRVPFKESRDRKIDRQYASLEVGARKDPTVKSLQAGSSAPRIDRIAFRSFDRQWGILDSRVGDFLRPALHAVYGPNQIYMTSLLTEVLGLGPAAVATALIPDMHHFRGSFGGRHVIPLWRDAMGVVPNVTDGLLDALGSLLGRNVAPMELFAYSYAILATPRYVAEYWEELNIPGPRLPITKDAELFAAVAQLGERLLWLHTFGQRCVPRGAKVGEIPQGRTRIAKGTPSDPARYPTEFSYSDAQQELHVGEGVFSGVRPEVWDFSVSGFEVVSSWLGYRMLERTGKKSSPLDAVRPRAWTFDDELLELLWILDATVDILPQAETLLSRVLLSNLVMASALPSPTKEEREAPDGVLDDNQETLFPEGEAIENDT